MKAINKSFSLEQTDVSVTTSCVTLPFRFLQKGPSRKFPYFWKTNNGDLKTQTDA